MPTANGPATGRALAAVKEIRPYIYFAIALFLAGAALGMAFPRVSFERLSVLKEFAESLRGEPAAVLILAIFLKNASASAMAIVLGVGFGLMPIFAALTNGMLLGGVLLVDPASVWRILPHGIFELPAVFIAWGTGIWVGLWFRGPNRIATLKVRLLMGARIFLAVVLPLLAVAAVIEGLAAARALG